MISYKRPFESLIIILRCLHVPKIGSVKRSLNVYVPDGIVNGFDVASLYKSLTLSVTSIDEVSVPYVASKMYSFSLQA